MGLKMKSEASCTKIVYISMQNAENDFLFRALAAAGALKFGIRGVHVATKNRSSIDLQCELKWEGVLALIFSLCFEFSDQVGGRHLAEVALKRSLPVRGVVPGPRDGVWGRGYLKN